MLDTLDKRILQVLQHDASCSFAEMGVQVHASAPTCQRRVRRLHEMGLIESTVAILNSEKLAALQGHSISAIVEVSLDHQSSESMEHFAASTLAIPEVQQCYQVSPGPDFILILQVRDMPSYHALAQQLFSSNANVRNVRAFFSVRRVKFSPAQQVV